MVTSSMLREIMSKEGPIVQCVLLRTNGDIDQLTIDTTPRLNKAAEILQGPATFIGQYDQEQVVLMCPQVAMEKMEKNLHTLPFPYHRINIKGDILILRMDENAEPLDYTKDEYMNFLKVQSEITHEDTHEDVEDDIIQVDEADLEEDEDDEGDEDDEEDEAFETMEGIQEEEDEEDQVASNKQDSPTKAP